MEIKSITILKGQGHTDEIILHTDLPSPFSCQDEACFEMECPQESALDYVRGNFPGVHIGLILPY